MRRLDTYHPTLRPYAVDLGSLRLTAWSQTRYEVDALWFRRRSGRVVACLGTLHGYADTRPLDTADFLRDQTSNGHGGDCLARWNGVDMWAPQTPYALMVARRDVLYRMLDHYPDVPTGYDGWWTFR